MKKKDIITLIVATAVIVICAYFAYNLIFPKKTKEATVKTESQNQVRIPQKIDEKTFSVVNTLSDYGKPNLDGLGKSDLFQ